MPDTDEQHLRLLAIFHYVVAGITFLYACLGFVFIGFGVAMATHPEAFTDQKGPPPEPVLWLMFAMGVGWVVLATALAVCVFLAGRYLNQRRRYLFCMVVAAVQCAFMPFGTVLGVFTIVVLIRPTVKALFQSAA